MHTALEQKLYERYPAVFQSFMPQRCRASCSMMYCRDGWFGLIETAAKLLENRSDTTQITGIKEKFGLLRLSLINADHYARGIAQMTEILSGRTCERCGNPGLIFQANCQIACRCLNHAGPERISGLIHHHKTKRYRAMGYGWSRLMSALSDYVDASKESNGMSCSKIKVYRNGDQLKIESSAENDRWRGAIAFVEEYSKIVNERDGSCVISLSN